jgi:hypothetical protein
MLDLCMLRSSLGSQRKYPSPPDVNPSEVMVMNAAIGYS